MLIVGNGYGQNIKTTVFTLNLDTPTENSLQSSDSAKRLVIPARNPLAFKLENGNPYKYRYVINSKVVSFFGDAKVNYLDSVIKKTYTPENTLINDKTAKKDTLEKQLVELKDKLAQKNLNISDKNKILVEQMKIMEEIQKLSSSYNAQQIIKQNSLLANSLFIKDFIPKNEEEEKNVIKNALSILINKLKGQKSVINEYVAKISTEDFLNIKEFEVKRKTFLLEFEEVATEITKLNSDAMNFDDIKEDYVKNLNEFNTISIEIKQEISKMFQLKLHNYLLPVDVNGKNIDVVEVSVKRYDKTSTNPTPDEYIYNIYVKGGLKIDISAGLFISSLMDKEYETKDIIVNLNGTNETQKIIYEKNKGNYDFGFGSMINVSCRGGSWIRPAFNVGALFTANQKFQILSGLGFILGKEERIILHAGLSMGSVAEISNQFIADGNTSYNLGTSGQVSTVDKFKFGHFFGLTYNLGKTKTQTKN